MVAIDISASIRTIGHWRVLHCVVTILVVSVVAVFVVASLAIAKC